MLTFIPDTIGHHFFNNEKYCLPGQGNVGHDAKKFIETGLDPFIKYFVRTFFADFDCCVDFSWLNSGINDFRDCSPFLWVTSTISMLALERISNENNVHFILFLHGEWIKVSRRFSWKFLKKCFYHLRDGVSLFSQILQIKSNSLRQFIKY